jgi:hypothetical protein
MMLLRDLQDVTKWNERLNEFLYKVKTEKKERYLQESGRI